MEALQLVLYYTKKVPKVVKSTISAEDFIRKSQEDGAEDINEILDAYSKLKNSTTINVETWVFVDEDEYFVDNIMKIEQSPDFVEWTEESKANISKALAKR